MSSHQNLHVQLQFPNGNTRKQRVEVIAGPINDTEKLAHFILHPHPEGTKLLSAVRLGTDGKEIPGHPVTGPLRDDKTAEPFAPATPAAREAADMLKAASDPAAPAEARQEPFPSSPADADVAKPEGSRAKPRTL